MNPDKDSRTAGRDVPATVAAALTACGEQYRQASAMPHRNAAECAVRAERLALVCARRAGWWGVLHAASLDGGVAWAYRWAVIHARGEQRDNAKFWRDTARDWRTRADRHDDDRDGGDGPGPWAMWDDGVAGVA